jgi:hypothetical protein
VLVYNGSLQIDSFSEVAMSAKTTIGGIAAVAACLGLVGAKSCAKTSSIVARTGTGAFIAGEHIAPRASRAPATWETGAFARPMTHSDDFRVAPAAGDEAAAAASDDAAHTESWQVKLGKQAIEKSPDIVEKINDGQDRQGDRR